MNPQDESAAKFACGLIVDISLALGKEFSMYTQVFIQDIDNILANNDYTFETKTQAFIALGDICLAVEDDYVPYLEKSMNYIIQALNMTLNSASFSS